MRKLPIGPIVVGLALLGLIGAFLFSPGKAPPKEPALSVVTGSGSGSAMHSSAVNAQVGAIVAAPSAPPTPLAPGQDPPARREPGAINYADKGVLPAL